MRTFIFCLFVGLAYSSIVTDSENAVEKLIEDVKLGGRYSKTLKEALDLPNSVYVDKIESDIKDYALNIVRKHFTSVLEETEAKIHSAEDAVGSSQRRIAGFEDDLKKFGSAKFENAMIAKEVEKLVSQILGNKGTQLPDDVKEILKKVNDPQKLESELINKLTSSEVAKDIRNYIQNLPDDVEADIGLPLKQLLAVLSDSDIQDMIKYIISPRQDRSIFDFFLKIQKFFQDLGIKISTKFSGFSDWALDHWNRTIQAVKAKSGPFTALAKEFLGHAKDLTKTVALQALQFFKDHKADIAKMLFTKILTVAKAAILA